MLNGDGNENCKKINSPWLATKKKNFTHAAHFFVFLVHFFAVVLHDHNLKLSSYTFYGKKCRMCSPKILLLVFQFRIFFLTAVHFYLAGFSLLTASISHLFNRRYKIFMLFFLQNSCAFFISRSSSFSLIHVSVDIKTKSNKKLFFSL